MASLLEYKGMIGGMPVNRKDGLMAPHKGVMLLAVIRLIDRGVINTPLVPLSDNLIRMFETVWQEMVPSDSPFSCKFSYPFYHLQSSPFWLLIKASTFQGQDEYSSLVPLKRDYVGARIDSELFQLLADGSTRNELRDFIERMFSLGDSRFMANCVAEG